MTDTKFSGLSVTVPLVAMHSSAKLGVAFDADYVVTNLKAFQDAGQLSMESPCLNVSIPNDGTNSVVRLAQAAASLRAPLGMEVRIFELAEGDVTPVVDVAERPDDSPWPADTDFEMVLAKHVTDSLNALTKNIEDTAESKVIVPVLRKARIDALRRVLAELENPGAVEPSEG